jgi:protein-L-isoaspartate(D-aspartate) O-methyltransferase
MPDANPVPATAPDLGAARDIMVDGQLRPNRVTDPRVIDTMRRLPRERFVPAALAPLAYIDDELKLTANRVLMRPLALARLIQLAAPRQGETALVVGAGSGYGAAVLAACGVRVTALEQDAALLAMAHRAAPTQASPAPGGTPVNFVAGKLADGWPEQAPYDLVFIEGAVQAIPDRIGRQVAQNGRLVTVLAPKGGHGVAVVAEPSAGGLSVRPAFDVATPYLPELLPAPAFTF